MKPCFNCKKQHALTSLDTAGNCPDCAHQLPRWEVRLLKELLTEGTHTKVTDQAVLVNNGRQAVAGHSKDHAVNADNEEEKTNDTSRFDDSDDESLESLRDPADEAPSVHPCDECSRSFDSALKLANHTKRSHILKCSDCDSSFSTALQLKKHEIKEHGREKTPVREKDTRYEKFVKIVRGADIDEMYACKLCTFRANRTEGLRHIRGHVRRLTCPMCDEIVPDAKLFEAHKAQPHPNLKFECEPCKLVLPNLKKLQRHKQYFHVGRKCQLCEEKIPLKQMRGHLKNFHSNELPTCGVCGLIFTHQWTLLNHQKMVHLKEKNVSCEICNAEFYNHIGLKKHMISHKKEKLHECRFCNKKFPRKTTLAFHEKIHTGEKNKVCVACGAAFVQKASLNYHMMKHHPDRV